MLLIPRTPEFAAAAEKVQQSTGIKGKQDPEMAEEAEMKMMESGADAIPAPAPAPANQSEVKYRLVTIGKKHLPDPEKIGARGGARKEVFWATVTALGDNLEQLRSGLGPKTYETKTRGELVPPAHSLLWRSHEFRKVHVMKSLVVWPAGVPTPS